MKEQIGKYWLTECKDILLINYRYSFSDLFSGIIYLFGIFFGIVCFYFCFRFSSAYFSFHDFSIDRVSDITFWLSLITGIVLTSWYGYSTILFLHNPAKGLVEVNKQKRIIVIRRLLRSDTLQFDEIESFYCNTSDPANPREKFGMLSVRKKDGSRVDCFMIRSSIPVDFGNEIEKDLQETSGSMIGRILEFVKGK